MQHIAWLLFTITAAIIGSWIGLRIGIPAGALIGAICSVGLLQILTGSAWFPPEIKPFATSIIGAYLGMRITRADIQSLKKIPAAAAIMVAGMLGYNIVCGIVLQHLGGLDIMTGILASAPGGMTEMSLVALDLNANSAIVSSIQMIRFAVIAPIVPILHRFILAHWQHENNQSDEIADLGVPLRSAGLKDTTFALAIGLTAGMIGKATGLPAGTLCFSLAACASYNLYFEVGTLPTGIRYAAQCSNGALIGIKLLMSELLLLGSILPVVIIVTLGWIVVNLLLGWALYRYGKLSPETALFAAAPGGMSDMALISAELGGNSAQVTVLQLCRVVCVIILCPSIALIVS